MSLQIKDLEKIRDSQEVIDMYVEKVDDNFNLIGYVGKNIKAILPRAEFSSIVEDDGLVDTKNIVNKAGKRLQVCIKQIIVENDSNVVIVSKIVLELKVRKWMYLHLKPGIKLKGIVRGATSFAAFIDVGGGVTGMLKLPDITDMHINEVTDVLKLGQRIDVVVKSYDRDTGKIELSYKELLGSFEKNVKKIKEGDIIEGIARNRSKTGIYIELKNNLSGIADHVAGIEYGQRVLVSVKRINLETKKIKLIIIG